MAVRADGRFIQSSVNVLKIDDLQPILIPKTIAEYGCLFDRQGKLFLQAFLQNRNQTKAQGYR